MAYTNEINYPPEASEVASNADYTPYGVELGGLAVANLAVEGLVMPAVTRSLTAWGHMSYDIDRSAPLPEIPDNAITEDDVRSVASRAFPDGSPNMGTRAWNTLTAWSLRTSHNPITVFAGFGVHTDGMGTEYVDPRSVAAYLEQFEEIRAHTPRSLWPQLRPYGVSDRTLTLWGCVVQEKIGDSVEA